MNDRIGVEMNMGLWKGRYSHKNELGLLEIALAAEMVAGTAGNSRYVAVDIFF